MLPARRWLSVLLLWCALPASAEELFVVHFATGPAWDPELTPGAQPGFADHGRNLKRLRSEGRIVFGARYGDYGMIVLRSPSLETARALVADDPGVRGGIFSFQVEPLSVFYPWRDALPARAGADADRPERSPQE